MNIKTIFLLLMVYNVYRLWCFYFAKDKVKMRRAFYATSAYLAVIGLFVLVTFTFFPDIVKEITTNPAYTVISRRLSRVFSARMARVNEFISLHFWYAVIITLLLSVGEYFTRHILTRQEAKHGPKFGTVKSDKGIFVGKYDRNVLPKQVRKFSPNKRDDISIPLNRLSRGITILGDMGCGKSRLMAAIHNDIREKYPDIPILIHDPKGEWLRAYYDIATDHIFAPHDVRSISWALWDDFKAHPELRYPIISTAVESHHGEIERHKTWTDPGIDFLDDVTQEKDITLSKFKIQKLKEENKSDRTWTDTYFTIKTGLRDLVSIELMNRKRKGLSIDGFLKHKGRIFLLNNPSNAKKQHGALTLFLSAFMIRALAGPDVPEDKLRAVVIMDEALTFHLPTDVERAVFTQSRSKGLCVVAGAQRLPKENQGERGAWSDHPAHIFGMRVTNLTTRQILAKRVGGITYDEKQKSKSTGDKSSSQTESEAQRQHDAIAPEDWALQNREFILFHETGLAPGRVKDVKFEQREDIQVTEGDKYDERKDVTDFMASL